MLESSKGIANRNKMKENRIFIFKEMVCGQKHINGTACICGIAQSIFG